MDTLTNTCACALSKRFKIARQSARLLKSVGKLNKRKFLIGTKRFVMTIVTFSSINLKSGAQLSV